MGADALHSDLRAIQKPTPPDRFVLHEPSIAEMRWESVPPTYETPNDRFFVRSQGPTPRIDAARWRLRIDGPAVDRPFELTYDDLLGMPAQTISRAIECAGNGRRFFERDHGRIPPETPWGLGGIGVARWTGVPLHDLLDRAGISDRAVDVMPRGLDREAVRRPIPVQKAREEDTLVAFAMNGDSLPPDHGFPARVLVSGWVGIASIKWVGRIEVSDRPLSSPWNTERYVLSARNQKRRPLTQQVVKSAIELPWPARLRSGWVELHGRAWSGTGAIAGVEVTMDGGGTWQAADLIGPNAPGAWTRWRFGWDAKPGHYEVGTRATDDSGNVQPARSVWNDLGYLYGAVVPHPVDVKKEQTAKGGRSRV